MRIELNTRTNEIKKIPLKKDTEEQIASETLAIYAKAVAYEMDSLCANPGQEQKFLDTFILMVKKSLSIYKEDRIPKL